MQKDSSLPYIDSKPVGAPDFYFAINATFRFIRHRLGDEALRIYWRDMGIGYFRPVADLWRKGGLPAIARYWRDFFEAEPGSDVHILERPDEVILEIKTCPAIAHLRKSDRTVEPLFCQHCYFVSEAMASPANCTVRVRGGNGTCIQRFSLVGASSVPQDLQDISHCL